MNQKPRRGQAPGCAQDEQRWGNNLLSRFFLSLPFVGATSWVLIDEWVTDDNWTVREDGPTLLALGILSLMIMRPSVRITPGELRICILLTRRIPRAEVESAKFSYHGLVIQRRDGRSEFALLAPRLTSTELSWGAEPEPGSAAYEITRWAQQRTSADPPAGASSGSPTGKCR